MNKNIYTDFNFKNYSSSGAASAQHNVRFHSNVETEKVISDTVRKRKQRRRRRNKNLVVNERMICANDNIKHYEPPNPN